MGIEYSLCMACAAWVAAQARRLPRKQKSRVRVPGWQRDFYALCASGAQEVLPCKGWGVTASKLDLPSLTPLSVAGCGRLQLEAAHWATWVILLQVVDNWPHKFSILHWGAPGQRRLYFSRVYVNNVAANYKYRLQKSTGNVLLTTSTVTCWQHRVTKGHSNLVYQIYCNLFPRPGTHR